MDNETSGDAITENGCYCVQPVPRIAAKSDKKQLDIKSVAATQTDVEPLVQALHTRSADNFISPQFKLSSLRISRQGRAPPRPNFG